MRDGKNITERKLIAARRDVAATFGKQEIVVHNMLCQRAASLAQVVLPSFSYRSNWRAQQTLRFEAPIEKEIDPATAKVNPARNFFARTTVETSPAI